MAAYDLIAVNVMASKRNGTLYLGVTNDLFQRVLDHREGRYTGSSKKYDCKTLVWWEQHDDMPTAIKRETQMKGWKRAWKLSLIEKENPLWRDLYEDLLAPNIMREGPDVRG